MGRAHSKPKVAMREGDWKILAHLSTPDLRPSGGITEEDGEYLKTAKLTTFELYNLRDDPGETMDVATEHPDRVRAMAKRMRALHQDVCQESPGWPEWEFARYEAGRIVYPDLSKMVVSSPDQD